MLRERSAMDVAPGRFTSSPPRGRAEGDVGFTGYADVHHEPGALTSATGAASSAGFVSAVAVECGGGGAAFADRPSEADRQCWSKLRFYATLALAAVGVVGVWIPWTREAARDGAIAMHSFRYFILCLLGGVVSGLAHTAITPVDLIKCRIQVGEYRSFRDGVLRLYHGEAERSLRRALPAFYRGWEPTLGGYCTQGGLKYFFYEVFKYLLAPPAGAAGGGGGGGGAAADVLRMLAASCIAEFLADIALAPWEAVKIKMQTTRLYPPVLRVVVPRMFAAEGWAGFFKGLPALWMRQVPYTMVKFASFETIVRWLYRLLLHQQAAGSLTPMPLPAQHFSKLTQLCVSLVGGCLAGVLCAVSSHPADTVVSKLNQRTDGAHPIATTTTTTTATTTTTTMATATATMTTTTGGSSCCSGGGIPIGHDKTLRGTGGVVHLLRELSWAQLWKGLAPRTVMVGFLTAMQWVLYDSFKVFVGLPTTGGAGAPVRPAKHL